jgi:hypothetical protein
MGATNLALLVAVAGSLPQREELDYLRMRRSEDKDMETYLYPKASPKMSKNIGIPLLLGAILGLWAEATIMVVLMAMAGICTLVWIIRCVVAKGKSAARSAASS